MIRTEEEIRSKIQYLIGEMEAEAHKRSTKRFIELCMKSNTDDYIDTVLFHIEKNMHWL